jgi:hypothetical protein
MLVFTGTFVASTGSQVRHAAIDASAMTRCGPSARSVVGEFRGLRSALSGGRRLHQRARLVEFQTRTARHELGWISVTEIAQKVRLDVPRRKELLLAAFAFLPAPKNSSSSFALSKLDIEPQSIPSARAASIR